MSIRPALDTLLKTLQTAAGSLGLLKAAGAVEPLTRALSHASPQVRATVAWALSQLPRDGPAR